jgi:SAM-dependent methyltransferase
VTKREAEWALHQQELAGASGDTLRRDLDQFWLQVKEQHVISGTVPETMIPDAVKMNASIRPGHEYREAFSCRDDWQDFVRGNRAVLDERRIDVCAATIARKGIKFRGQTIKPSQLDKASGNYRESFVYQGVNSRKRALLVEMFRDMRSRKLNAKDTRVYAPEALGGFAAFLAAEFPLFQGSEYLPDPEQQRKLAPVEHQDLAALTYPDAAFDYVLVNDIFEHVPDLSAVLGQVQRVLAPGGVLLSTFPFALKREEHLVKATLDANGHIEYHMEPEYHEDPVDDKGVLVFQLPGWNILKDCRSQGFAAADMVFLCSPVRGVLANDISGVMLLKATNPA